MNEEKVKLKLINIALIAFIIAVGYLTSPVWWDLIGKISAIIIPFIIAFAIAYALYPFLVKLQTKGVPKTISISIIVLIIIGFIGTIVYLLIPIIYDQVMSLVNITIAFVKDISNQNNIDLSMIQERISDIGSIVTDFGNYLSNFGVNLILKSINFIVMFIIIFIVSIYMLGEMINIRNWVKKILIRNRKRFEYVKKLDHKITNYFEGIQKLMIIQFFEYTIAFLLIGHPYFLLMGILASITTVIPYFGGIFANIIAILTAALISTKLLVLTIILALVLPNIDGYIISPRVYAKSNNIHPLVIIFSVFAGGILAGFIGILISLPLAIILIATYQYYEKEILFKIKEKKEMK